MTHITHILQQAKEQLKNAEIGINRCYIDLSYNEFIELFVVFAEIEIKRLGKTHKFIIDKSNENILKWLYSYSTGTKSTQFNIDFNKGILLIGGFGVGKTLIMKAYISLINSFDKKIIKSYHSKELTIILPEVGLHTLLKKPLFVDDIGKENREVKVFGTIIQPFVDLISLRYEHNTWNFATANYKLDTLKEKYGETITDRMKDIYNIIELNGKSKR